MEIIDVLFNFNNVHSHMSGTPINQMNTTKFIFFKPAKSQFQSDTNLIFSVSLQHQQNKHS